MKRAFVHSLVLLILIVLCVSSCNPHFVGEPSSPLSSTVSPNAPQSPLVTPTPQATPTPTCNPPWPTPAASACPWLPTPEPTATLPFPSPTPFTPPTPPERTPTPLPLPQAATSPAGRLLWRAKTQLQDGSRPFVLLESQVHADGTIAQPYSRIFLQPPPDRELPAGYDYSMWFNRFVPSPDGRCLVGIYESEVGESATNFDLTTLKSTLPMGREVCWINPDGFCVTANGYFYGWHPNSQEILFREDNAPDRGLWLVDVRTGEHLHIAHPPMLDISGATISPDGQRLIYATNNQIWTANADGSEPHLLLESDTVVYVFSWSPDGRYLLYVGEPSATNPDGRGPLWVMNREGGNRRPLQIPFVFGFGFEPVWSPTGRQIAAVGVMGELAPCWQKGDSFLADPLCRYRSVGVYVETVDTGKVQLVADNAIDPAWSPDGSLLAVSRMDERGQVDIWMVNAEGSGLRRVTDTPELDCCPIWLPIRP